MTKEYKELRDLKFKIVDLIENNLPDVDVTNSETNTIELEHDGKNYLLTMELTNSE